MITVRNETITSGCKVRVHLILVQLWTFGLKIKHVSNHHHSDPHGVSRPTYLQAPLGRCRQLLGPVLTNPPNWSQLLLQLLLPSGQCWIRAARKEPVILNQFCATGKEDGLGWGTGGGQKVNWTNVWPWEDGHMVKEMRQTWCWWCRAWGTWKTTNMLSDTERGEERRGGRRKKSWGWKQSSSDSRCLDVRVEHVWTWATQSHAHLICTATENRILPCGRLGTQVEVGGRITTTLWIIKANVWSLCL